MSAEFQDTQNTHSPGFIIDGIKHLSINYKYPYQKLDQFHPFEFYLPQIGPELIIHIVDYFNNRPSRKYSFDKIVEILIKVGNNWLKPDYQFRQLAVQYLPSTTGFSSEMIREAIDISFQELIPDRLNRLKNHFVVNGTDSTLVLHILAGNVFVSGLFGIIYGLIAQKPQLIKTSSQEPLFPVLFAQSISDLEPELGHLMAVCSWKGGDRSIEDILFKKSGIVIVYGDDPTIRHLSENIKSPTRFYGFGHKFSFGIIGKEFLTPTHLSDMAKKIAYDIAMYDQQGCLSPQFYYLEKGGDIPPQEFSEILVNELRIINTILPRGHLGIHESALIIRDRTKYEFRKMRNDSLLIYSSGINTDWTVVYSEEPEIPVSSLNRFILLKPFLKIHEIIQILKPLSGKIQSVGLALDETRLSGVIENLKLLHIHRFCKLGDMQKPHIDEIYDGKPNPWDFT